MIVKKICLSTHEFYSFFQCVTFLLSAMFLQIYVIESMESIKKQLEVIFMKLKKKIFMTTMAASLSLALAACGSNGDDSKSTGSMDKNMDGMDHSTMDMSGSKEVPKGLQEAKNPKFKVGDMAMIKEAHMEGMKGAEAKVVGAYDTTAYSISYDPINGGKRVTNHKWIIQEEIVDAKSSPYEVGDEVKVDADHMKGMKDATATIDSAKQTTVYMIDFESTTGEEVKNHKWVTEDELSAE